MFEIEDNVPLPSIRSKRKKYPVGQLEVGQSFFVPESDDADRSLRSTCSFAKRNTTKDFTVRKVSGGYRVWRIQ